MAPNPERAKFLFLAAADLSSRDERAAYLYRECGADTQLRARVEALLADDEGASLLAETLGAADPADANQTMASVGFPATSPSIALPPQSYVVGREIAHGGMGSVLHAQDCKLGRNVAMKVMRLSAAASEEARSRFVREATVLARLEHPNIVPIHELGWDAENRLYYTMKLVQGRTLQAILNGLRHRDADFISYYTLDRLLTIFRKICDAMSLAHAKGVIHRDLKPENVMVGEFGEVLVMDWGLAKIQADSQQAAEEAALKAEATYAGSAERFRQLADSELRQGAGLTLDGTVMGTPHYMSPEQAQGRGTEVDQQSDIFSLGGILYALLTLHPPVDGKTADEIMGRIRRGEILPPTAYNGTSKSGGKLKPLDGATADARRFQPLPHCPQGKVPLALSSVTMRALAVDKSRRYGTVADLAADIEAYQGGFATSAEEAGLFTQLRLLVRRHKREFAIGFAAWFVITALAVWFVINLRASERRATWNADLAQRNERQSNRNAELATNNERRAAQNADLAARNEHKALDEKEATRRALARAQIALADSAFRSADLSGMVQALNACPPDLRDQGWNYLDAKRDTSLGAVKIAGWKNVSTVTAVPGNPGQFLISGQGTPVAIVDVADSRIVKTIDVGFKGTKRVAFSGDGRVLAVTAVKQKSLGLFDAQSGSLLKKLELPASDPGELALNQDGSLLVVASDGFVPNKSFGPTCLVDTRDGRTLWSFILRVQHVAFSGDGSRVMVSSRDARRQFNLLRTSDGGEISHFDASVRCQALSPSGKEVALGSEYGEVFVLDAATGALLRQGRLHTGAIDTLAWTSDGALLSAGTEGKFAEGRWVLRLWEPAFLTPMATFFGLKSGQAATWSMNRESGDLLTVENPPRLWRMPVGRERVRLTQTSEQGVSACFLSDTVLLGRKGYGLTRYDLTKPGQAVELPSSLLGPDRCNLCIANRPALSPSKGPEMFAVGKRIGFPPYELRILTGDRGELVEKMKLPVENITLLDLDFDLAGERLAVLYANGRLQVFDAKSGKSLLKVPGNFDRAAFAAGNTLVATRETRQTYKLIKIDAANGTALNTVDIRFRVNAFAVSPDRRLAAVAGSDQSVHLFDADKLIETTSFRAHDGDITALAFHPTDPLIATAAMDHSLKLWDYTTARLVNQFIGLRGTPVVLSFNPSGSLIVVDGQEYTTRVFDIATDMVKVKRQ